MDNDVEVGIAHPALQQQMTEVLARETNAIERAEAAEEEISDLKIQLKKLSHLHQGECVKASEALDLIGDLESSVKYNETTKSDNSSSSVLHNYEQVLRCAQNEITNMRQQFEEELNFSDTFHESNSAASEVVVSQLRHELRYSQHEARVVSNDQQEKLHSLQNTASKMMLKYTKSNESLSDMCESLKAEILRLTIQAAKDENTISKFSFEGVSDNHQDTEDLNHMKEENDDLKSRLKSRNEALLNKTEEADDLQARVETLEHLLSEAEMDKTTMSVSSTGSSKQKTSEMINDDDKSSQLRELQLEYNDLKAAADSAEMLLDELMSQSQSALEEKIDELEDEVEKLTKIKTFQQLDIQTLRNENTTLRDEVDSSIPAEQVEQYIEEISVLQQSIIQTEKRATDQRENLADIGGQLKLKTFEARESSKGLNALRDRSMTQRDSYASTISSLQDENTELKNKNSVLNDQLNGGTVDASEPVILQSDFDLVSSEKAALSDKYDALSTELESQKTEITDLKETIATLQKSNGEGLNDELKKENEFLKESVAAIDLKTSEIGKLQQQNDALLTEIDSLRKKENDEDTADLKQRNDDLFTELESQNSEISDLRETIATLQKSNNESSPEQNDEITTLKTLLEKLENDSEILKNKNKILQKDVHDSKEEMSLKTSEIDALKKRFATDNNNLKERVNQLEKDDEAASGKLSSIVKDYESYQKTSDSAILNLKEDVHTKETELQALKDRFAKDMKQKLSVKENDSSLQKEIIDLQDELSNLTAKNIKLVTSEAASRREIEDQVNELQEKLKIANQRADSESAGKDEIKILLSEQKAGNLASSSEIAKLTENISNLRLASTEQTDEIELLREQISKHSTEDFKEQIVELKQTIQTLQQELSNLKIESNSQVKKLQLRREADTATHNQETDLLRNKVAQLENNTTAVDLKNENLTLQKSNQNLKSELQHSATEQKQFENELRLSKAETDKMTTQLRHSELSLSRLHKELAASKENVESNEKISDLQNVLQTTKDEGEGLKQKLKEARTAVVAGMAETTRRMALEKRLQTTEEQLRKYKSENHSRASSPVREHQTGLATQFSGATDSAIEQQCQLLTQQLQGSHNECASLRQKLHQSRLHQQGLSTSADVTSLKQELNNCRRDMVKLANTHKELLMEFELVRNSRKQAEKRMMEYKDKCQQLEGMKTKPISDSGNLETLLKDTIDHSAASTKPDHQKVETLTAHLSQILDHKHMSMSEISDAVLSVMTKRHARKTTPVRGRRFPSPAAASKYPAASYSVTTPQYVPTPQNVLEYGNSGYKPPGQGSRKMSPGRPTTPRLWR